jgi:hypothetical protein
VLFGLVGCVFVAGSGKYLSYKTKKVFQFFDSEDKNNN